MSKYLEDHPGGPEIILDVAGKDATEDFEDTGHSGDARETMKEFLIGQVEGMEEKFKSSTDEKSGSASLSKTTETVLLFLGIFAGIAALALGVYYEEIMQHIELIKSKYLD